MNSRFCCCRKNRFIAKDRIRKEERGKKKEIEHEYENEYENENPPVSRNIAGRLQHCSHKKIPPQINYRLAVAGLRDRGKRKEERRKRKEERGKKKEERKKTIL